MEGVDAESAVPPPAVVFLHVVSVVRGVGDAPEEIPAKWAHRFLQMDRFTRYFPIVLASSARSRRRPPKKKAQNAGTANSSNMIFSKRKAAN